MTASHSNTTNSQALLAEQAQLVARLGEITALLASGPLPPPSKTAALEPTLRSDFDRKAYAIGLIWRNPNISTRNLAKKVGVAKSTLFLPGWKEVGDVLRARRNLSASDFKGYHTDPEDDE